MNSRELVILCNESILGKIAVALLMSDISLQVSTGLPDEQMHPREDYILFHNPIKINNPIKTK